MNPQDVWCHHADVVKPLGPLGVAAHEPPHTELLCSLMLVFEFTSLPSQGIDLPIAIRNCSAE